MSHLPSERVRALVTQSRRRRLSGAVTIGVGALSALAFATAGAEARVDATAASPVAPPPVTILSPDGASGRGDIFIAPTGDSGTYANGPEILSRNGNVLWFRPVPAGQEAADFRAQRYRGKPVLTYWQGTGLGGLSNGTDYVLNRRHQTIATVRAGDGLTTDGHEFLITPQNTALVLSYTAATANLSSIGGPADQTGGRPLFCVGGG